MAVRSKDELTNSLKAYLKEDVSDEALALLEDINDTYDSLSSGEDWKSKYEENDAAWRQKYAERFQGVQETGNLIQPEPTPPKDDVIVPTEDESAESIAESITIDDLFG